MRHIPPLSYTATEGTNNGENSAPLTLTNVSLSQINFKSYRGVYVKHTTTTDPAKGRPRRRVVVERMTLPPARSAATVAASTAHLSSTGGALASTLIRPATLAASGLSTLGHTTVSTLSSLAYTLHHGERWTASLLLLSLLLWLLVEE